MGMDQMVRREMVSSILVHGQLEIEKYGNYNRNLVGRSSKEVQRGNKVRFSPSLQSLLRAQPINGHIHHMEREWWGGKHCFSLGEEFAKAY